MGLNDIRLTPAVTAVLYQNSLVETESKEVIEKPHTIAPAAGASWKSLGNNEKNILIVVYYDNTPHLPDDELSFLTNILAACKLTLGDVAIVNTNNYGEEVYRDFIGHFLCQKVLLFGVSPAMFGLPIDFPPYQVQSFAGCRFLFSPALEDRHKDELFKSKLWVSLRRIFDL